MFLQKAHKITIKSFFEDLGKMRSSADFNSPGDDAHLVTKKLAFSLFRLI